MLLTKHGPDAVIIQKAGDVLAMVRDVIELRREETAIVQELEREIDTLETENDRLLADIEAGGVEAA